MILKNKTESISVQLLNGNSSQNKLIPNKLILNNPSYLCHSFVNERVHRN